MALLAPQKVPLVLCVQCTIEIAWVDLGRPYPGSYKQEILANRGQKVCSRSTGAIQSCTANMAVIQELTGAKDQITTGMYR